MSRGTTYDNILSYVEDKDDEIAGAFRSCCLEYLFNPKNKSGITLLLPSRKGNSEARKSLIDMSYGVGDDKHEVMQKLAALVLSDKLSSPDVFRSHADDIPNGLKQHVEIDLARSTNNTIVFKNGATAVLDTDFSERCSKKNLNVYILSNGLIPIDGPRATFAHSGTSAQSNRRRKAPQVDQKPQGLWSTGGNEDEITSDSINLREKIARETEDLYLAENIHRSKALQEGRRQPMKNIYMDKTLSLINFILTHCSDQAKEEVFVNRMFPLLSFEHFDFYLFVEPSKSQGSYLIPTDIIRRWYSSSQYVDNTKVITRIEAAFGKLNTGTGILGKRVKIQEEIDSAIREELVSGTNKRVLAENVNKIYNDFISTNKIGSIEGVLPEGIQSIYRESITKKIAQDEIRYFTFRKFSELEYGVFDRDQFINVISLIRKFLSNESNPGNIRLLNKNTLKYNIQPQEKIREIMAFINSRFFMFIPMSIKEIKEFGEIFEIKRNACPDGEGLWFPTDRRTIAIQYSKLTKKHDESRGFISDEQRAMEILKTAKAEGKKLDPGVRAALASLIHDEEASKDKVDQRPTGGAVSADGGQTNTTACKNED